MFEDFVSLFCVFVVSGWMAHPSSTMSDKLSFHWSVWGSFWFRDCVPLSNVCLCTNSTASRLPRGHGKISQKMLGRLFILFQMVPAAVRPLPCTENVRIRLFMSTAGTGLGVFGWQGALGRARQEGAPCHKTPVSSHTPGIWHRSAFCFPPFRLLLCLCLTWFQGLIYNFLSKEERGRTSNHGK